MASGVPLGVLLTYRHRVVELRLSCTHELHPP